LVCVWCVVFPGGGFLLLPDRRMEVIVRAPALLTTVQNVSEMRTLVSGQVIQVNYENGDTVQQGDVLWVLDNRSVLEQIETSELQLERARSDLQTSELILRALQGSENNEGATSTPEALRLIRLIRLEEARLKLDWDEKTKLYQQELALPASAQNPSVIENLLRDRTLAQNAYESYGLEQYQTWLERNRDHRLSVQNLENRILELKERATDTTVVSPITGTVEVMQKVNVGDSLLAGDMVLRVIPEDTRNLKAVISVSSGDIAQIKEGMTFRLNFPKLPPSEFGFLEGTLYNVPEDAWLQANSPPIFQLEGELSRTFMTNQRDEVIDLKSGMTADARIIVRRKQIWNFLLERLDFL
jgi:multidrug resistance efflux pump